MTVNQRVLKTGSVDFSHQLVERSAVWLPILIADALKVAGMTAQDSYWLRLTVIELPDGDS